MYEEFFSLSGSPFKLNPDPKFFFGSRSHNKAMAYLHYGLKQAEGFIVITGPIGAGKTMVISQLLDQLASSNVIAAQLLTSNIEPDELLDHILSSFRIEPEGAGRTGKLEAFEDYLFDQLNRGRRVLLIMDEAQNLPFETLEELRMLSNIDYDGTPLFQVFLVGQPEFRETLQSSRLEQLRQRVIASYHLENLDEAETREYILHRLSVSGWAGDPVFTDNAFSEIHQETGGRPRRINTVCNRIMLFCSLEGKHEVTGNLARTVIEELHDENLNSKDRAADAPDDEGVLSEAMVEEPAEAAKPLALVGGDDVVVSLDTARGRSRPASDEKSSAAQAGEDVKSADSPEEAEGEMTMTNKENEQSRSGSPVERAQMQIDDGPPPLVDDQDQGAVLPDEADAADAGSADSSVEDSPEESTDASAIPAGIVASGAIGGGSVLDRLRAKRSGSLPTDNDEAPREATLEDVASAIANAGGQISALPDSENDDFDGDLSDEAILSIAPADRSSGSWRDQVSRSIEDTKGELREAHASVRRLKKSLSEMQKRNDDRRDSLLDSLKRAELHINALQDNWRD